MSSRNSFRDTLPANASETTFEKRGFAFEPPFVASHSTSPVFASLTRNVFLGVSIMCSNSLTSCFFNAS